MLLGKKDRKFKLGMCYFAEPSDGAGGTNDGVGGGSATDDTKKEGNDGKQTDAKFTQDDINKIVTERIAAEKTKHEKELADLKTKLERESELAKMSENERVKAELEDFKKKYQEEADKNALAVQTEETRTMLEKAELPTAFLKFVQVEKDSKQTQLNVNELKTVFDSEIKKGVEAQIKTHKPTGNVQNTGADNQRKNSGPSYSGFNLQNSIAEYYNK